jgi:PD-(D/E)XK nuclease superfamily
VTNDPIRISAKTLGALAMPGFCARCFWIERHLEARPPFQIFPGIFSSIDSYSKKIVHGWLDRHGEPPAWLRPLGNIKTYKNPPSASKFNFLDGETSIRLTGMPDGILAMDDGSTTIIDYKTARFSRTQDELFPLYEAQLNAYASIGERVGFSPVRQLALIYTEPVTNDAAAGDDANLTFSGFQMGFRARIKPVEIRPDLVPRLLRKARAILDLGSPPTGAGGCANCAALAALVELASS